MDNELIMYILVNEDLKMSVGKTSAQVAHSIVNYMETYQGFSLRVNWIKYCNWKEQGQKKIVLKAPQKLLEELEGEYWSVRDNGLTEIPPNSLTVVCLGVNTREEFLKSIPKLKRLRLL